MKQLKLKSFASVIARIVLAVTAAGCSANAAAQAGVIVNDTESMAKQIAEYAEQAKRWGETLAQYQKEIAHYQQMISTITGFSFQSLLPTQPLQKMNEQQRAQQACPGSGNVVSDVLSAVTGISLSGSIVENAQKLCVMSTQLKVKMYNETVDQANRVPQYNSQISKITDLISKLMGSSSSVGDTQKLILENQKLQSQFSQEMQAYESNMKAYQSMLVSLNGAQSTLKTISLKGKPSPLGTVIQAGAFAGAFSK